MCENYFLRWTALFLIKNWTCPRRKSRWMKNKQCASSAACEQCLHPVVMYLLIRIFFFLPLTWNGEAGQLSRYSDEAAGWTTEELGLDSVWRCSLLHSFQTESAVRLSLCSGYQGLLPWGVKMYVHFSVWLHGMCCMKAQRRYLFTTERDLSVKGGGCDVRGCHRPRSCLSIPPDIVVKVGDLP